MYSPTTVRVHACMYRGAYICLVLPPYAYLRHSVLRGDKSDDEHPLQYTMEKESENYRELARKRERERERERESRVKTIETNGKKEMRWTKGGILLQSRHQRMIE